jgi:hypothetical protein
MFRTTGRIGQAIEWDASIITDMGHHGLDFRTLSVPVGVPRHGNLETFSGHGVST